MVEMCLFYIIVLSKLYKNDYIVLNIAFAL